MGWQDVGASKNVNIAGSFIMMNATKIYSTPHIQSYTGLLPPFRKIGNPVMATQMLDRVLLASF